MTTIGDMARALTLRTNQFQLRQEMDRLSVEVSTGVVQDRTGHLGGNITGLLSIERNLARLDVYRVNSAEAELLTGTMQSSLDNIQTRAENLSQTLQGAELTPSNGILTTLATDAEAALGNILNGLNSSVAGRYVFSGTASQSPAVLDKETFLAEIETVTSGLTSVSDIESALDSFFDPGGGFETAIYQGSTQSLAPLQLSETESAFVDIRADRDEVRELLKPIAMATLANRSGFDSPLKIDLLSTAASDLRNAIDPLVNLRASLGTLEARIEETNVRNESERTASELARLDLIGVDDYEAAARYENIRGQLESLYAITARSQRLSLAEYL